jgi:hypothetical protein
MATIQNLPSLTTATGAMIFPIVDVTVTPNVTKKTTLNAFVDFVTYKAPIGYTGSQGYNGSLGFTGSRGFLGSIGFIGSASTAAGYAGSRGFLGSIGFIGSASTVPGYVGSASAGYIGSQGAQGPAGGYTGSQGQGLTSSGTTSTSSLLPNPYLGNPGDAYFVADTTHLWVWNGSSWVDNGTIQGPTGYVGSQGFSGSLGYDGSQGYVGSTGAGYTGSASTAAGYAGSRGFVGSAGVGSTGYTGSQSNTGGIVTNPVLVIATTASVSTGTGAFVVQGGVGINGDINVGGVATANGFISASPTSVYDLDVSGKAASYAPGTGVTFSNFSGMIVMNEWTGGGVAVYAVGGGFTQLLGTPTNTMPGVIGYNGSAYIWINNSISTCTVSFALIRTRAGA